LLHAELALLETSVARYEDMTATVGGASVPPGAIERITHAAQLSLGGELRFGYRLIPTLAVGVGPLIRWRAAGIYVPLGTTPDGFDDEISVDLAATVRVGLDVRLRRRWVFGASVGATQAVPLDGPAYQALEAYGQLAYFWYPLI